MNGYSVPGPSGSQAQLSQQGSFNGNGSSTGMMNGAALGQPYQQQHHQQQPQPYAPGPAQQQQQQYPAQQQPPPSGLPQLQQLQRPSGSQATGSDAGAPPPQPSASFPSSSSPTKAAPPRPVVRKRQRIEYEPLRHPFFEFPASWDPVQVEEVVSVTAAKRAKRTAKDLGVCDIRTLTMSLRSRLGSEVSFALNSLGLLSAVSTTTGQPFMISLYPELFDELAELLEEVVEGADEDDWDGTDTEGHKLQRRQEQQQQPQNRAKSHMMTASTSAASAQARSRSKEAERVAYNDVFREAEQEELDLLSPRSRSRTRRKASGVTGLSERDGTEFNEDDRQPDAPHPTFAGLDRAELALQLLSLFRNFSYVPENLRPMLQDTRVVRSCLLAILSPRQVEAIPLDTIPAAPLRLSRKELLGARKDVVQFLGNLGYHLALQEHPSWVAQAALDLVDYFLEIDSTHLEHTSLAYSFGPGLDAALYAWSRLALPDANRDTIAKLGSAASFLERKTDILLQLLPVQDPDLQYMTSESSLLRIELVAMSLFNTVYISSADMRKQVRDRPGPLKILTRLVKKLYQGHMALVSAQAASANGASQVPTVQDHQYLFLCQRCLEVIRLLTEDEVSSKNSGSGSGNGEATAWFGSWNEAAEEGESASNVRSRASLLFVKQDFVELMSYAIDNKSAMSLLADCT